MSKTRITAVYVKHVIKVLHFFMYLAILGAGSCCRTQPSKEYIAVYIGKYKMNHLFNKWHSISAVVPPLEDEDEAGDEGGGSSERHVELGSQGGQEHCRHLHLLVDFQRSAQIEDHKGHLKWRNTIVYKLDQDFLGIKYLSILNP